ncbi:cupin domain-containing protein [Blautia sp. RD014234]|nr:cupin domain-containing protein [Blautia parvula]
MNIDPAVNDNLKEQAAHGSHEFPLQVYQDMEYCENGPILYNHWHEEAEILFVTEGMMELVVDGISIIAGKDTIVPIPQTSFMVPINTGIKPAVLPPLCSTLTLFPVKIRMPSRPDS